MRSRKANTGLYKTCAALIALAVLLRLLLSLKGSALRPARNVPPLDFDAPVAGLDRVP